MDNNQMKPEWLAISPLDGRYHQVGEKLAPYFSEFALVKNRVKTEVYFLKFLLENIKTPILDKVDKNKIGDIISIYTNFDAKAINRVKEIESVTNHDVKAVELYIDEKLDEMGIGELKSYVHIGCTSEDINNTAYATMLKEATNNIWIPSATKLYLDIAQFAINSKDIPMLAHTHGQPATPTTIGKEFAVFAVRLKKIINSVKNIAPMAKFNGATGNYAAIKVTFPNYNWPSLAKKFVEEYLGLAFNPVTTQIENHDYMCKIGNEISQFNNVLQGFDWDIWQYVSMEYLKQIPVAAEVGSSTMPHKINPIRFENSATNCGMSTAIFNFLSNKLPYSRMQRDLSDSSAQRNLGLAYGYSLQAIEQTIGGLKKVCVNEEKLAEDLNNKWEVLAEAIQTVLRKYGIPNAYDQLKALTRGKGISKEGIIDFVKGLNISTEDKKMLLNLTPSTYIGYADKIVNKNIKI